MLKTYKSKINQKNCIFREDFYPYNSLTKNMKEVIITDMLLSKLATHNYFHDPQINIHYIISGFLHPSAWILQSKSR